MDYHDDVEEAQEANSESTSEKNKKDEKLLDIENESKDTLIHLDTGTNSSKNGIVHSTNDTDKSLEEFFGNLILEKDASNNTEQSVNKIEKTNTVFSKSSEEQKSVMDIFEECNTDFNLTDLSPLSSEAQQQQSLNLLASESAALFDEILNDKQQCTNNDWEGISHDTFLPPSILKQSLGDAALGMGQKSTASNTDDKVSTRELRSTVIMRMYHTINISQYSFHRKRIKLESRKVTHGWIYSQNWIHWLTIQWRIFPGIVMLLLNSRCILIVSPCYFIFVTIRKTDQTLSIVINV